MSHYMNIYTKHDVKHTLLCNIAKFRNSTRISSVQNISDITDYPSHIVYLWFYLTVVHHSVPTTVHINIIPLWLSKSASPLDFVGITIVCSCITTDNI